MAVLDNQGVKDTCALLARIIIIHLLLYTALSQRHVWMNVCNTVNGYDMFTLYSMIIHSIINLTTLLLCKVVLLGYGLPFYLSVFGCVSSWTSYCSSITTGTRLSPSFVSFSLLLLLPLVVVLLDWSSSLLKKRTKVVHHHQGMVLLLQFRIPGVGIGRWRAESGKS